MPHKIDRTVLHQYQYNIKMFVQVALTLITFLVLSYIRDNIQHLGVLKRWQPIQKLLQHWNGQDRIFKLFQNSLIFVAGLMDAREMYVIDHARMIIVSKTYRLDNISNGFAFLRKITRFPQTRHIFANVKKQVHRIHSGKCQKGKMLEQIFAAIADGLNCIYFCCDHYMALCVMSVFTNLDYLPVLQFWFSSIWLMSSIFSMLKDFAIFYRYFYKYRGEVIKLKKVQNDEDSDPSDKQYSDEIDPWEEQQKLKKHLLLDFSKNTIDIITNCAAMYPAHFAKSTVGLLGATESMLWMVDYLRVHG